MTTLAPHADRAEAAAEARARYPAFEHLAYLNAGAVGPMARDTHLAMVSAQAALLRDGRGSLAALMASQHLAEVLRERIGGLIGVGPDHLVLTGSTTEGCNIALQAMHIGPDDEVVTTDDEHPALGEPLRASGARLRIAAVVGRSSAAALDAVLDQVTHRTRLIAVSHVCWMDGLMLPVDELKRRTALPMLVDGAQSVGAVQVSAEPFDFYTVSGQKWLCGPELTGALYVREPERWQPRLAGFPASMHSDVRRYQVIHHPRPVLQGLGAALQVHPTWGFEHAAAMAATARIMLARDFHVIGYPGDGTLVTIAVPGDPQRAVEAAQERGVIVRPIPGRPWIRISCGYWTNEEDIERLRDVLVQQ